MTFAEFKSALRSFEESEKSRGGETGVNVMSIRSGEKFEGNCFKCGKKGHRISECWSKSTKTGKWCSVCKTKSHTTKECRANAGKTEFAKRAEDQEEHEDNKMNTRLHLRLVTIT